MTGKTRLIDVALKQLERHSQFRSDSVEDDEDEEPAGDNHNFPALQPTESILTYRVNKVGTVSIQSAGDARVRTGLVRIVECPFASFIEHPRQIVTACEGESEDVSLSVKGVAPLSLEYHRQIRGRREQFVVEGIQGESTVIDSLNRFLPENY